MDKIVAHSTILLRRFVLIYHVLPIKVLRPTGQIINHKTPNWCQYFTRTSGEHYVNKVIHVLVFMRGSSYHVTSLKTQISEHVRSIDITDLEIPKSGAVITVSPKVKGNFCLSCCPQKYLIHSAQLPDTRSPLLFITFNTNKTTQDIQDKNKAKPGDFDTYYKCHDILPEKFILFVSYTVLTFSHESESNNLFLFSSVTVVHECPEQTTTFLHAVNPSVTSGATSAFSTNRGVRCLGVYTADSPSRHPHASSGEQVEVDC